MPLQRPLILLFALLLAAVVLRAGVLAAQPERLADDPDAYVGIARMLAEGEGFASPHTGRPTAYRPPLYPAVLAGLFRITPPGWETAAIGGLHLILGTATVLLTWIAGRGLGMQAWALAAAGIVAIDPLLLQYTALPMTETICAFVAAAVLAVWSVCFASTDPPLGRRVDPPSGSSDADATRAARWRRAAALGLLGVLFGLFALARPTAWAFGALWAGWWLSRALARLRGVPRGDRAGALRVAWGGAWPVLLGTAVAVAPWGIRNLAVFGRPILTTTHGGYTLLLGNNPVFYREVVDRPWGTVWNGDSLSGWQASLEAEMRGHDPPPATELERDRWMQRRALAHIADEPGTFARACWLRFRRFWNVAPLEAATDSVRRAWLRLFERFGRAAAGERADAAVQAVRWGVGLFYIVVTAAMVLGLARLRREEWPRWMPAVLLVASFSLVHLVYWSNARMRAPVIPAVALFAARSIPRRSQKSSCHGAENIVEVASAR